MKLSIETSGGWDRTEQWLKNLIPKTKPEKLLDGIDRKGVEALRAATPVGETGQTAFGWDSQIESSGNGAELSFINTAHPEESVNIAKIKDLGHGTGTGGYVPPNPYISNAMQPVWKELDKRIDKELR